MRFPRQRYWSGLLFPSPGDLPNPGIKPRSPALKADSLLSELQEKPIYTEELYKKDLHNQICPNQKVSCWRDSDENFSHLHLPRASLVAQMIKESAYNAGDLGSIPGLGRSPGERNGYLLQYSCLGNLMDRGAWWAAVHGVAKSQTQLSN